MFFKKAYLFFIGGLLLILSDLFAQDQKIADSLFIIYKKNILSDSAKLILLRELSFNEMRDLKKGLQYAEDIIVIAEKIGHNDFIRNGYYLKGTKQRLLGDLDDALAAYIKSIEIAKKIKNVAAEGEAYGAIADTYTIAKNYKNAGHYYQKAIVTLRLLTSTSDSLSLASLLCNAGDAFRKSRNYDSEFLYLKEATAIFEKVDYQIGKGYCLGNIGMVNASIGKNKLAEQNMNEAISILEKTQDFYPICEYLISMADVYLEKGDNDAALTYILRSFSLAEQNGLKDQMANASLKLAEIYESKGDINKSFKYYKKHI